MSITVTLPTLPGLVGPGLTIHLQSSFIGPFPTGTQWRVTVTTDSEAVISGYQQRRTWSFFVTDMEFMTEPSDTVFRWNTDVPKDGDTVHILAEIVRPDTTVEDSGSTTATFDATSGLGWQQWRTTQVLTGGFTETDRATITSGLTDILNGVTAQIETASGFVQHTLAEIFSRQTLDLLTLTEVSDGETFDQVSAPVDSFYYGVIVRVTTIPDAYQPRLIDGDWRYPDLAVLRIYRGVDLELRKGIHTSSWMERNPWGYASTIVNLAELETPPPETSLIVDWALGCAGRVFLMRWP